MKISTQDMARRNHSTAVFLLALISLLSAVAQAEDPNGPLAVLTLGSQPAYKAARKCAQGCLVYNGPYYCQIAGYDDLGAWLGCGRCGPINGCVCSAGLASSATSYIQSCVSKGCAGVGSWEDEVTSMLSIYDGYCATANVAPTSTSRKSLTVAAKTTTTTAPGPTAGVVDNENANAPNPGATSNTGPATETGGAASGSTTDGKGTEEKQGLSQSDIVALAASLGVGIPSLLIAGITLCIQLRKRRRRIDDAATVVGFPSKNPSVVNIHTMQAERPPTAGTHPYPYGQNQFGGPPDNIYEVGDRGFAGQRRYMY
ncbi:hypothetical protein QBC35DRAFT_509529 [Podospora australis]|uniref:Mid2 domain-containing protein n=1 Tax=Podospora australis TaxID=1536484 RepID=A0AAN6WIW5_9PEZI|nr:hypothetical protein QBC35DRAFT_509529 [Podospora australis]